MTLKNGWHDLTLEVNHFLFSDFSLDSTLDQFRWGGSLGMADISRKEQPQY